jgi:hypothetical protein
MANETGLITRWYMEIVELLMLDWARYGVTVKAAKHIGSEGSHLIHYFGVICEKTTKVSTESPPAPKTKINIKTKAKV